MTWWKTKAGVEIDSCGTDSPTTVATQESSGTSARAGFTPFAAAERRGGRRAHCERVTGTANGAGATGNLRLAELCHYPQRPSRLALTFRRAEDDLAKRGSMAARGKAPLADQTAAPRGERSAECRNDGLLQSHGVPIITTGRPGPIHAGRPAQLYSVSTLASAIKHGARRSRGRRPSLQGEPNLTATTERPFVEMYKTVRSCESHSRPVTPGV